MKVVSSILAVAFALFCCNIQLSTQSVVYVTTKNGTIKGYTARSANNVTIYSFMKIPFAKPPLGDLRFKNPEPQNGWGEEILDGTQLIPACPQFLTGVVAQNEDCLYLNVYSSRNGSEPNRAPAPVMVFMFGGAFVLGESSYYTGHRLLDNDAVLVVPNYRVSALGFFSTGDEVSPGNYGLKDQNLALRWVQENIAAFGGDPNRVTIFGESAGGTSVIYHLLSAKSHGLFHGVIAQSGTAIEKWGKDENPLESAQKLGRQLNCPVDDNQKLVDCLRGLSTDALTTGFFNIFVKDITNADMGLRGTNPVIEPDLPGAFITEDPYKLLRDGNYPDVPVLLGCTSEEGAFFLGGFHVLGFGNSNNSDRTLNSSAWMREDMISEILTTFHIRDKAGASAVEETIAMTFMDGKDRLKFDEIAAPLVDISSVYGIKGAVLKTANILSQHLSKVYLYSFEYQSNNSRNSLWYYLMVLFAPIIGEKTPPYEQGVVHADDLIYEFNLPFILTAEDKAFSKVFCELFVNFATSGNPTPNASNDYPQWPQYHWRDPKYMVLDAPPSVANDYAQQWLQ